MPIVKTSETEVAKEVGGLSPFGHYSLGLTTLRDPYVSLLLQFMLLEEPAKVFIHDAVSPRSSQPSAALFSPHCCRVFVL